MNPQVGPGDLVQLRLAAEGKNTVQKVEVPAGWSLVGAQEGFTAPDGVTYFTIQVARKEKAGIQKLRLIRNDGAQPFEPEIEVVRKMGV